LGNKKLNPNQTYHIAYTYDQNNHKIYVDGEEDLSVPSHGNPINHLHSDFLMGKYVGGRYEWFGTIYSARIHEVCLSKEELNKISYYELKLYKE
jgi:hypothetical protein